MSPAMINASTPSDSSTSINHSRKRACSYARDVPWSVWPRCQSAVCRKRTSALNDLEAHRLDLNLVHRGIDLLRVFAGTLHALFLEMLRGRDIVRAQLELTFDRRHFADDA